ISQTVSTAGANGTTDILSDQITSAAQQLLSAGNITQDQYNSLISLANQGHGLATIERNIETAAIGSTSEQDFENKLSQLAGVPATNYGMTQYVVQLGYNTGVGSIGAISNPLDPSSGEAATAQFLNAYSAAQQSGAMSDPAVQQLVSGLATQIA